MRPAADDQDGTAAIDDDDLPGQIGRLETEIEELAEIAERCRKIILASKAAIAIGGVVAVVMAFGAVRFDLVTMMAAFAAVFGGAAMLGSNASTLQETMARMKAADRQRTELIGDSIFA